MSGRMKKIVDSEHGIDMGSGHTHAATIEVSIARGHDGPWTVLISAKTHEDLPAGHRAAGEFTLDEGEEFANAIHRAIREARA